MKSLIIFPPQWMPFSPHLAGPVIHGIIKSHGHEAHLCDLNAEFYNSVLTPEFLYESIKSAFADFEKNSTALFQACSDENSLKDHPKDFQSRYKRYQEIFRMAQRNEYRIVIKRIAWATGVMQDKDAFYDPALVAEALVVINKACGILSATHHPSNVYFSNPSIKVYYSIDSLMDDCENLDGNIFRSFFEPRIESILSDSKPEFIGISIGDYSQLLPGLTLAMLLKKSTDAHICIGGNLFGRYTGVLVNNPEFFRLFTDFVIFNEGEKPVVELLAHLEGKAGIEDVPNLIYLNADGHIVINEEATPFPVNTLPRPEFSDLQKSKYYLPEVIYNIQASRSCYWKKCSFCTHHAGSRYSIKPVEQTVAEIMALQNAHGARFFHLVDEAISPAYLKRFSQALIDAGVEINFYIYAKIEKAFDREIFRLAYRAGLRMVLWGFESASERVYHLMNKGNIADKNSRLKVLEAAYEEGVWNFLFLMFGFPTETLDEAKETVDFVRDHRGILSHGTGSTFMLLEDSPMLDDLQKYSITSIQKMQNGFNFAHRFTASQGMNAEQKSELEIYKATAWRLADMKFRGSDSREKLFLYLCKYGAAHVSEMNRTVWL
ncbi:MAG: radical SAM protein [Nitrosomonadales bacterium]|nr:radical SAM protein [Nitrosomonadales bacterium]